ncbi:MAG: hypothetical protein LBM93_06755 [Oscillospiraceae bacterium]|jgi:hypothetical protein|nr:hypothetical protein [Oscillospiraceae bacterium]
MNLDNILNDPESLQNIKELAEMFKDEFNLGDNNDLFGMLNGLIGTGENSKNIELLVALKPHLSEEKQLKVDKAIKILKLIELLITLNETGLLNDIL